MTLDPGASAAIDFLLQVERCYAGLHQSTPRTSEPEPTLGGKLLFAGELIPSRALIVAANIAGAASLSASADATAQKQAIRDGVIDFLVNSLDEALRILKNEIRKRQPVAVCVSLAPELVEREMEERGVLPDLLASGVSAVEQRETLVFLSVASAPALWLPRLDEIALDCLDANQPRNMGANQPRSMGAPGPSHLGTWETRWLRLSPRYLGRLAQGLRLIRCSEEAATSFVEGVRAKLERGEIGVPVEIKIFHKSGTEQHTFTPPTR
jgi:hypothetical protein